MTGKCPRCQAVITSTPDAQGVVTCGGCGLKLRSLATSVAPPSSDLQALLEEVRHLRRMQGEILQYQAQMLNMLKSGAPPAHPPAPGAAVPVEDSPLAAPVPEEALDVPAPARSVPRVRQRRKTVLLVDDNEQDLKAAIAALGEAQGPMRHVAEGKAALEAIAAEKPDVLVVELALGGATSAADLISMIKATMEWVDMPIVLYTREAVADAEEARVEHGADDLVLKGTGSPEALVNRVIKLFQRK
jgi:CheY-like chemotaxis protein